MENLALAYPTCSEQEREAMLHRIYRHLGLLFLELLRLPTLRGERLLEECEVRGREHYEAAIAQGKGVIIVTAHLGNWELGLSRAAMLGHPCNVITREIKSQPGKAAAAYLRESQVNVTTLPKRGSMRSIIRILRGGGIIGMVLDQNRTREEGVFVDFFDHPACTSTAPAVLVERIGATVVPLRFHRREDDMGHVAEFLPPLTWEAPCDTRDGNIRHNTQRYTAFIEDAIRRHPEQWIWMHRRWRTQPPAIPPPTPVPASAPCAE